MMSLSLLSLLLVWCASQLAAAAKDPLVYAVRKIQNDPPLPTSPAKLEDRNDVQKRSSTTICGYNVKDPTDSYYCDPGYICGFNTVSKLFGCCGSASGNSAYNCFMPTTCFNYGALSTTPPPSNAPYTASCTDPAYPYCETLYDGNLSNFDCTNTPALTTYFQFTMGMITTSTSVFVSATPSAVTSTRVISPSLTTGGDSPVAVGVASTVSSFSQSQASGSSSPSPTTKNGGSANRADLLNMVGLLCVVVVLGSSL